MFALRRIAQVAPQACRMAIQQKGVVGGPPTVRISLAEKTAHGLAIAVGLLFTPWWVMSHLQEYRGTDAASEEAEAEE